MATLRADDDDQETVEEFLESHKELKHLRARRRADCVIIESGSKSAPEPRARLRRTSVHRWQLEMADHRGKWEPTPVVNTLDKVLATLFESFPWALTDTD